MTPGGKPIEQARQVLRRHEAELLGRANVIGVGVGLRQVGGQSTDEVAIVVLVRDKKPRTALAPEDLLPPDLQGVPVDVQEIGAIRAQD